MTSLISIAAPPAGRSIVVLVGFLPTADCLLFSGVGIIGEVERAVSSGGNNSVRTNPAMKRSCQNCAICLMNVVFETQRTPRISQRNAKEGFPLRTFAKPPRPLRLGFALDYHLSWVSTPPLNRAEHGGDHTRPNAISRLRYHQF